MRREMWGIKVHKRELWSSRRSIPKVVSGGTPIFRQRHRKLTTAPGQVKGDCEEIIHRLVREIDLGKDVDKDMSMLDGDYGPALKEAFGDTCHCFIDKAEGVISRGGSIRIYECYTACPRT